MIIGILCAVIISLLCAALCYGIKFIKHVRIWMQEIREHIKAVYYFESENNLLLHQLAYGNAPAVRYDLDDKWNRDNPIICHAMGEIDGILFTESLEAFEKHYNMGSRVFEADFCLTSDGEPVILHDWRNVKSGFQYRSSERVHKKNMDMTGYADNEFVEKPMTDEEFSDLRICGKYTTLNLERLINLMAKYQDAYLIVSVKSVNQEYDRTVHQIYDKLFKAADRADPSIRGRLILHAYSFAFYYAAMEEFHFHSAIYRLRYNMHPEVLAKELKKNGITTITTTVGGSRHWPKNYLSALHNNGIKVIGCITTSKRAAYEKWGNKWIDMVMTPYGEEIRR